MNPRFIFAAAVLCIAGLAVFFVVRQQSATTPKTAPAQVPRVVITTTLPAHRTLAGQSLDGTEQPAPPPLALSNVLLAQSGLSYAQRLAVIHALPAELGAAEHTALLATVSAPGAVPGLTPSQSHAFKNDSLNALLRQPDPARRAEVAARLRTLAVDPAQDPVMRDYSLQHLASLGPVFDDGSTHLAALDGTDSALAATALLHLLARERSGDLTDPLRTRAAATALRLASDASVPEPSRATALQVCARLKLTEARPLAETLARSDRASFPLRIAAVAALGDLGGDAATRDYLTSLTTGPERRLRVPAQAALKRFSSN